MKNQSQTLFAFLVSLILLPFTFAIAGERCLIFKIRDSDMPTRKSSLAGNKILGHRLTVENLMNRAANSQADFISVVDVLKANGKISGYKSFWIVNAVSVTGDSAALAILAGRPDVEAISENIPIELIAPLETTDPVITSNGPENGLHAIEVPQAWAMGLDGSGSLVCNFDTGVNGNHPALMSKYRGNNGGTAAACWFDPYSNTDYPVDNQGHGTHTMGIMVGADSLDSIGVAPGAQWIAAGVVDRGGSIQRTISDILSAFQWAADPDGDPSTIDDVPDVVNNSWGIPLGYFPSCDATFWEAIDNLESAGVVCLFAAGNEGSMAETIRTPADRISSDFNAFSVGAVDGNDPEFPVAYFSSRGPSGCDHATIKPEVTAPGVAVRSAGRYGGYVLKSGTSMAAPHVAGAVAILRQFNPQATPAEIKQALMSSAVDLGQPGEDNDYGWGMINIRRALYFMPNPETPFAAYVSNEISGDGIALPGETIELNITLENIGAPADNMVATLASPENRVEIASREFVVSYFGDGDTASAGPWTVHLSSDIPNGECLRLDLILSETDWQDTLEFSIIAGGDAAPAIATHRNNQMALSFSNTGQFGLGERALNPMGGDGFLFPIDGPEILRNGSLLLATDSMHVSDAAMSDSPYLSDNDFSPCPGGRPRISEPGLYADQDGFAAYTDGAGENPIGIKITQNSYCWTNSEAAPLVIFEFNIRNISDIPINGLYAGIFCDWDTWPSAGEDDIVGYDPERSLGFVMNRTTGLAAGITAISSNASSYFAIDNNAVFSDGFSNSEKFAAMIAGFDHVANDVPANYSQILTIGPMEIEAGDTSIVTFALLAGNSLDELIGNARSAARLYQGLTGIINYQDRPEFPGIMVNYPNPFNESTVIRIEAATNPDDFISIFDITGRLVREIPITGAGKLVWDGRDSHDNLVAGGVYFARLNSNFSIARKILLLK